MIYTQIDRKVIGASPTASAESTNAEGEPGNIVSEEGSGEEEGEESASAVLSKLTKYIYNCQTLEQTRSVDIYVP